MPHQFNKSRIDTMIEKLVRTLKLSSYGIGPGENLHISCTVSIVCSNTVDSAGHESLLYLLTNWELSSRWISAMSSILIRVKSKVNSVFLMLSLPYDSTYDANS